MSLDRKPELTRVAKQVCRDLRRASTRAERMLWEEIRGRKFLGLKFYRQYPLFVDTSGQETFFVADFYCHEQKLVIELDGGIHNYQNRQDLKRTEAIRALGISVVRFKNEDIEQNIAGTLSTLGKKIRAPLLFPREGERG